MRTAHPVHRLNNYRDFHRRACILVKGGAAIDCTVRNISIAGAVFSHDGGALPPRFVLDFSGSITVRRACELVYQNGGEVGVSFPKMSAEEALQFDLPPPSPEEPEPKAAPKAGRSRRRTRDNP